MATAPRTTRRTWRAQDVYRLVDGHFDLLLFAVFAALSVWVLALQLQIVAQHPGVWSGTDGIAAQDQMQYLAWIRDAADHGLSSNLYTLEPRPHDYLQPLVAVSALLTALGVAPWLALLLWKPFAVVGCFAAVRALVRTTVRGVAARRAALALSLLFIGWGLLVTRITGPSSISWWAITNELWIPFWTWGYSFAVISFAAMVGALLCYARDRSSGRVGWMAPALGTLSSWVHPWQGETLILMILGAEAVMWRARSRARLGPLLVIVGATALPLAYYAALGHFDDSWRLAREAGHRTWPLWIIAVSLAPLALPALLAYRTSVRGFLPAALRVWPLAAFIVFLVAASPRGSGALHAFLGISVPLAILAVEGVRSITWRRRPPPAAMAAAVVLLIAPPTYDQLRRAHETLSAGYDHADAIFIAADEDRALDWLADVQGPGGVLTGRYLGTAVPGRTGRPTWIGNQFWTPDFFNRSIAVADLFRGMSRGATQRFVQRTGARFVLAGCDTKTPLRERLTPILISVHVFGCARVFEVRRGETT